VEAKLADLVSGVGEGPEFAVQLLEDALEARVILDAARAVLHEHLQAHLGNASLADTK